MKIVYGVEYIEVEFGQRPFGWHLYLDKTECHNKTKKASDSGRYCGGYLGPIRPLDSFEIPFASLSKKIQRQLTKTGHYHTDDSWKPEFLGKKESII